MLPNTTNLQVHISAPLPQPVLERLWTLELVKCNVMQHADLHIACESQLLAFGSAFVHAAWYFSCSDMYTLLIPCVMQAAQSEKKGSKASKASAKKDDVAAASSKGPAAVGGAATAASPSAATTTKPVVVSSDATPAETPEVVGKDVVQSQSA